MLVLGGSHIVLTLLLYSSSFSLFAPHPPHLQASKAMLAKHIRVYPSVAPSENPRVGVNGVPMPEGPSDAERDELRFALVAAQDSAAVQILLEW